MECRSECHGMDHDRIVALNAENTISNNAPLAAGPMSIVRSSAIAVRRTALRAACQMSASLTPCFRAGSPIRTQTM